MAKLVGIVGSRDFPISQQQLIIDYVNQLPAGTTVVSGGARGVDTWAEEAAKARGLPTVVFLPKWIENGKLNKRAGFIRNEKIVAASDEIVSFWDGKSKGAQNTMHKARSVNKPVIIIRPDMSPEAQERERLAQLEQKEYQRRYKNAAFPKGEQ